MSRKGYRYGSMTDQPLCMGNSERVSAYKAHKYSLSLLFDIILMRNAHGALNSKVGAR